MATLLHPKKRNVKFNIIMALLYTNDKLLLIDKFLENDYYL